MSLTKVSYSMINGAPINVLDYGAIGNGVHDDTANLQAAIDAAYNIGGGVVSLPQGTFKITSTLNLKQGVRLVGESMTSTTITGTFANVLVTYQALVDGQELVDIWIEHLTIDGGDKANGGTGVAVIPTQVAGPGADSCRLCGLLNVRAINLAKGLHIYSTQQFSIERCKFQQNTVGVYATTNESVTGVPQLVRFEHCDFRYNGKGIDGNYVSGSKPYWWTFENCHFESNTTHGLDLSSMGAISWAFRSCKWEQNGTNAIDLSKCDLLTFNSCYFNGNPISGGNEQVRAVQSGLSQGGGHRFEGCIFGGSGTANDARFDYVPRIEIVDCQLANGFSQTHSEIRQTNTYRGLVKNPASVERRSIAVWIDYTMIGSNYVGVYPKQSSTYMGNCTVWIDSVTIDVTDAFVKTGGTYAVIQTGDDIGAQAIGQSTDVLSTGRKSVVLNTNGYLSRGANYFVITLVSDGILSAGKALVMVNYSEIPAKI